MKTIIAGGRGYTFTEEDKARLDQLKDELPITLVITGGATGADFCGEMWAAANGIPVKSRKPDWLKFGAAAGPIRNSNMANEAEALIAFPGGRGTADMIRKAKAKGLKVIEISS